MVEMKSTNWKSADQGRGLSGVEVKLRSRLGWLETSSLEVTSSIRNLMMAYEEHMVDERDLKC